MSSPMRRYSSGPKPRVVVAGVPTRIPEAVLGGSGSKGMAFLLTVMPTSSRSGSASLAGDPERRDVDEHQVVVGAAGDDPGSVRDHGLGQDARVLDGPPLVLTERLRWQPA